MLVDNHGKIEDWDASRNLCAHFKLSELANNSGNKSIPQFILDTRVEKFLSMLEELRVWYNKPIVLSCGYRQPAWNKSVGGDVASPHLHACAVDWTVKHTDAQRENVKNKWFDLGKKYGIVNSINYYTNGYHLESYTDVWYGNKTSQTRDYRGKRGDW